jgi:hypothetical protein
MPAREHKLPEEFSLLNSEFNDFLFAPIGEEENHASLSVLSALSRQGIDPWQQAARLNRLPRDTAARRLGLIIEALPEGRWPKAEAAAIAGRLVGLLPPRTSALARPAWRVLRRRPKLSRVGKIAICASLLAASIFFLTTLR